MIDAIIAVLMLASAFLGGQQNLAELDAAIMELHSEIQIELEKQEVAAKNATSTQPQAAASKPVQRSYLSKPVAQP